MTFIKNIMGFFIPKEKEARCHCEKLYMIEVKYSELKKDYIDLEKAYFTQRKLKEKIEDDIELLMKRNYDLQRTVSIYLLEYGDDILQKDKRVNEKFKSRFDDEEEAEL